jgi:Flp pilus assembly pilin Flp
MGSAGWRPFIDDERGQGMVEYSLVIVTIAIVLIVSLVLLRDQLTNHFSNIGNALT